VADYLDKILEQSTVPLFAGTTASMGGKDWVVPPLTLGAMKRNSAALEIAKSVGAPFSMTIEQLDAVVKVVWIALRRNYPDLTLEMVEEMLDTGNTTSVLVSVLFGSGLVQSGEAQPVASLLATDSGQSMESLPPAVDIRQAS